MLVELSRVPRHSAAFFLDIQVAWSGIAGWKPAVDGYKCKNGVPVWHPLPDAADFPALVLGTFTRCEVPGFSLTVCSLAHGRDASASVAALQEINIIVQMRNTNSGTRQCHPSKHSATGTAS